MLKNHFKIIGLSALLAFIAAFAQKAVAQQNHDVNLKDFGFVKPKRVIKTIEMPASKILGIVGVVEKEVASKGYSDISLDISISTPIDYDFDEKAAYYAGDTIYFIRYKLGTNYDKIKGTQAYSSALEDCKKKNKALQADSLEYDRHEDQHAIARSIIRNILPGKTLSDKQLLMLAQFEEYMAHIIGKYHANKKIDLKKISEFVLKSGSYDKQFTEHARFYKTLMKSKPAESSTDPAADLTALLIYLSCIWNHETGDLLGTLESDMMFDNFFRTLGGTER